VVPTAVPNDHPEYYVNKARAIVAATPGADHGRPALQSRQPRGPLPHHRARDLGADPAAAITHFVCSPGTGGTISGVGRYLKEKNPKVQVVAGDPEGSIYKEYAATHHKGDGMPYKVEGIGGDKIPTSLHFDVVDEWITVSDRDAFQMARRCTREEGLFMGGSAGLNVFSALEVARRVNDPEACVVTIICDSGERYLSKLYDDNWMRENQLLASERVTAETLLGNRPTTLPPLVSIGPVGTVRQALNLMGTWGVSEIPVIDGSDCVGSLTEATLMGKALENGKLLENPVSEVMEAPYPGRGRHAAARAPDGVPVARIEGGTRQAGRQDRGHRDALRHPAPGVGHQVKICLLTGGTSSERDVALASGLQIAEALRERGHDVSNRRPGDRFRAARREAALLPG